MITHSVVKAEGRRLVGTVRKLAAKLDRPVCGRDVELYFRMHPHERPELMQAIGQLLLKASRPYAGVDRVFQIGIIGNRAYYAADEDARWKAKLARHDADLWLARAIREDLPCKVRIIRRGSLDDLARNAFAGWAEEMEEVLPLAADATRVAKAKVMVKAAKAEAGRPFTGQVPADLISRAETVEILKDELCRRADYLVGIEVNWNRIATYWTWPQSRLFPRMTGPIHSRAQIALLAAVLWPEPCEVTDRLVGELWARRYGIPGA